jgi:DNA-binding XRE family transcriptional regulator
VEQEAAARKALHALGFAEARETVPWREAFPAWSDAQLPGVALAGARVKEGVTQSQLAKLTGIPQRHISEMEHGKRAIGKERAKKLAEVLKIDYHVFL